MNEITIRKKEELDPQEKSFRRRKDLIKNFIIVFLVIMLVLTFFSNTIMNYSLPKVAVQYIQPGTITSVIRGQGTVESGDPYNVMVKQSKTVGSINCKVGQEIKAGDLLLTLEAEDSEELKTAKKALEDAKKAYNNILLSDKVDAAIISSAQGQMDVETFRNNITATQNAITAAEKNVDDCQAKVDSLNNQINVTSGVTITEAEKTNLENLRVAAENAKTTLDTAEANLTSAEAAVKTAEADLATAQSTKNYAKSSYDAAQEEFNYLDGFKAVNDIDADLRSEEEQAVWDQYYAEDPSLPGTITRRYEDATSALISAKEAYDTAIAEEAEKIASAQAYLDSARASFEESKKKRDEAQVAYTNANNSYKSYSDSLTNKQNNATDSVTNLRNQLTQAQIALTDATKVLETKKQDLADLVAKIGSITELTAAQDAIDEAQKNVDKYQEETGAADITSPINGTILSINVSSGKKTSTDDAVVVIQPEGMGYTMKFSLENEKAKTISIGDPAEVTNSWWYSDVTGSVATIRPDPSDPNKKKEVTLNLDGSLTAGQSLTMSISSRTQNYDLVVPSSSIHDGNNGKYILVIESKPSPLGNRYFANKYEVEVLANDDTQTAISAGLMGYEYVVTSSSKPIDPGAQVQLNE